MGMSGGGGVLEVDLEGTAGDGSVTVEVDAV